jgi:FkbM family methyltransferase
MAYLKVFRSLPWFKGKLRLGKFLFGNVLNKDNPITFHAHSNIQYTIPNTKENLGVELLINGIYERDIVDFLQHQITDGATYFDVGANIGSLALPILKSKKGINYFGFEASPAVFPYLEKNFKENDIKDYQLVNKLVHRDDEQFIRFYLTELYGKNSLAPNSTDEFVVVESVSVDSFCRKKGIEKINWMKVDVEGFEALVFEGMGDLLKSKKVENILFEFEEWAEERAGFTIGASKEILTRAGYGLFNIRGEIWDDQNKGNETMIWAKAAN